jgi:LCP family protein required for cell wall assembly
MGEHEAAPKTKKKRFRRLRWFIIPIVLILAIAGVGGYLLVGAVHINGEIKRINGLKHLLPSPKAGVEKATENILLVGSTDRCALSVQNPAYGLCQDGVDGINSDILMVLHLNPNNGTVSILSIPRDLFIPNARSTGANKVDAGLVEGPDQLIAAVEEDFGIPIQHFAELNFETFANVVNDLGGVKMYFPMPVYDKESGLNITTPGCHDLNGVEALQVVRSRHLHYDPPGSGLSMSDPLDWPQDPLSDLSRIRRTHEFLRVLAAAVSKKGLDNPFTDEDLIGDVASQLQVDPGLTLTAMVNIALTYHAANPYKSIQLTLPVVVDANLAYQYQGYNYGNVEFPDEPVDQQTIDSVLGINATTDSMTGLPLPAPTSVKVAVENGTGINGEGDSTTAALQRDGYSVVSTTDVTPVGPESETLVEYDSKSLEGDAERVARSLTGAVILAFDSVPAGAQVAVVTGSDFAVMPPTTTAPTTTTTTASSASSSTSSTTTSTTAPPTAAQSPTPTNTGSDQLTAPSPANSPLAPFDPRSCTASGGEGP